MMRYPESERENDDVVKETMTPPMVGKKDIDSVSLG